MNRASFTEQESPILLSVIRERTPDAAIAIIKNSIVSGAGGFDLHLSTLENQYLNETDLAKIISSTVKPVLALHYNADYHKRPTGLSDEARMKQLLTAVRAGAAAIDMQGYTFEEDMDNALNGCGELFVRARPKQVTMRKETIAKQCELINEVHSLGAQVVLSTHTGCMMTAEEAVSLAQTLEKRGADVVKIIAKAEKEEDVAECFRTVIALKKVLKTKFTYHLEGKVGKLTRIVAPMLGSYMAFCFEHYTESSNFEQCHLKTLANAFRTLQWRN